MTVDEKDNKKPDVKPTANETQEVPQKNPLEQLGLVINNHAASINETKGALNMMAVDVKTNKGGMDIFTKRFDLVERQLDNIENHLTRLENRLNEK